MRGLLWEGFILWKIYLNFVPFSWNGKTACHWTKWVPDVQWGRPSCTRSDNLCPIGSVYQRWKLWNQSSCNAITNRELRWCHIHPSKNFNIGFCEEQWLGYFNCCPVVSVLTFFFDDLMSNKPFYAEICLFKNKNRCVLPILKHCIVISLNGKQINNKRINETV